MALSRNNKFFLLGNKERRILYLIMTNIRYTSGDISSKSKLKSIAKGDKMRINVVPKVENTSFDELVSISRIWRAEIIKNVKVELILWGSSWNANPSPSVEEITHAVSTIVSSAYMTGLETYTEA